MKKVLAFCFLLLYNTSCRYDIRQTTLGFRQMVRHWILIPALWGFESLKPSPLSLAGLRGIFCIIELFVSEQNK